MARVIPDVPFPGVDTAYFIFFPENVKYAKLQVYNYSALAIENSYITAFDTYTINYKVK